MSRISLWQMSIVSIVLLSWAFIVEELDRHSAITVIDSNNMCHTLKYDIPTWDIGGPIEDTPKKYSDIQYKNATPSLLHETNCKNNGNRCRKLQLNENVDTLSMSKWQTILSLVRTIFKGLTLLNTKSFILKRRLCTPLFKKEACKQPMPCLHQEFCLTFPKTNGICWLIMRSSVFNSITINESIAFDEHIVSNVVDVVWWVWNRGADKVDENQANVKLTDHFSRSHILSGMYTILIAIVCAILILKKESYESTYLEEKGKVTDLEKTDGRSDFNLVKGEYYLASIWETLFGIRNNFTTRFIAFPFSLNQYADEIVKEHKSVEELMNYEWSRYLSFKTFPMDSVMTPMRLSQAGFYYTGHGEEVRCFCCGVTNGDWVMDDTAIEVHRRLSPNCKYLVGEDTNNIEIHFKEYYNDIFRIPNSLTHSRVPRIEPGATGGPTDTNCHSQHDINSSDNVYKHDANARTATSIPTQAIANENSVEVNDTKADRSQQAATGKSSKTSISMKHPQYAELETRVTSFMNWDFLDKQDPVDLANAGFFYAGVKDFVRCYVCGVGLKNWARGDDPWHEHARWSKSCSHLLQHRVSRGSNDYTTGNVRSEQAATADINHLPVEKKNNQMVTNVATGQMSEPPSEPNGLAPVAVRALTEMGYSWAVISEAIKTYHGSSSLCSLNAEAIVQLILDGESNVRANESSCSLSEQTEASPNNTAPTSSSIPPGKETQLTSEKTGSEDARSLSKQNRTMREQMMCKICMDRDANVVFLPCGHMVSCHNCAGPLRKCAVCRGSIRGSVRVYQS